MEEAIRVFAAVNFLTMGLSHVFQHRAWAEFFVYLHQQGRPGAFANGFLTLSRMWGCDPWRASGRRIPGWPSFPG